MSDELFALMLTLTLFVLLAVWLPILDLLQDAVRNLTIKDDLSRERPQPVIG